MASGPLQVTAEHVSAEVADSVASGERVRDRVRELTLQALHSRHFRYEGMNEVIEAVTLGISRGAASRAIHMKQVVAEALSGLDQALMQSAEASRRALVELAARHRELSDRELKGAVEQMKRLESDFVAVVNRTAESAATLVAPELRGFVEHAQRLGTETGTVVSQTMMDFSQRIATQMLDAQGAGIEAAQHVSERFAQVASGFLREFSQALREEPPPRDR